MKTYPAGLYDILTNLYNNACFHNLPRTELIPPAAQRPPPLRWYRHLVVVEGLESSSNPESYAGGSLANSRISQAGQVKRVGTRRREIPRRRELRQKKKIISCRK